MKDETVIVRCRKCGAIIREQVIPAEQATRMLKVMLKIRIWDTCDACKEPNAA